MSVSVVEISKGALLSNLKQFRNLVGKKVKIMAVVKGNAYGHGMELVSKNLERGVGWFGVDNLEEALQLHKIGIKKPILILGFVPKSGLKVAVAEDFALTVCTKEILQTLISLEERGRVHLKIETGTNRQGFQLNEISEIIKLLKRDKNKIIVEGISTHFANIEDTLDPSFAKQQLAAFKKTINVFHRFGINPNLVHTAATAATILYPDTHFNMVRVGIGLYGFWPSRETQIAAEPTKKKRLKLLPALSWKTNIVQLKSIKPGESVAYGRTWFATKPSKIGIIPIGYYDGLPRKLSNNGRVLIKGKSAPIVGRVMMNMIVVDVTDIKDVELSCEVVVIGKQGRSEITVEELATRVGTINYEIVSRINSLIPRVLVS